jgi:signal transduction histidine kinase
MLGNSITILLIEDSLAEARFLEEVLKLSNLKQFSLIHVQRLAIALEKLGKNQGLHSSHHISYDVILLDLSLPDSQGLASLAPLHEMAPNVPVVVLTNNNDDELAIEAVRQGAQDYLVKRQVNAQVLVRSLYYAIERKQMAKTLLKLNQTLENSVKEKTAELVQAQELNQLKSEFVSMLSHDIRNPLNTILLSTGLLQNHDQKLSHEKKLRYFQQIRTAIKDMAQLLDEVLLIGRSDAGKLQLYPQPLNLQILCNKLLTETQLKSQEKEIEIIFTTEGKIIEALWDESLLRHILENLLGNAIKYSNLQSQIYFKLIFQDTSVIFSITDTGIGIPQEDKENLFQPFHRAGNVGITPGTGLGLAIVKKCIDTYQGQIHIDSEEGKGTTAIVILPISKLY